MNHPMGMHALRGGPDIRRPALLADAHGEPVKPRKKLNAEAAADANASP